MANHTMPEPLHWNGGPDDTGRYIGRATGPRREPPAVCVICGADVTDGPTFGDVTCGASACVLRMVTR